MLLNGAAFALGHLAHSRDQFIVELVSIIEACAAQVIDRQGMPDYAISAGWIFDRLREHGWPQSRGASDLIMNELNVPLLQSALLRTLREVGRRDIIESELERADHPWIGIKCLLELLGEGPANAALLERTRRVIARSPIARFERLTRILDERFIAPTPCFQTTITQAHASTAQPGQMLDYAQAIRLLEAGTLQGLTGYDPPFVLIGLTQEQLQSLAKLLDPTNDHVPAVERYVAAMKLGRSGHSVTQRQLVYAGNAEASATWLRPALVSSQAFDDVPPWHSDLLIAPTGNSYVLRILASLRTAGGDSRFYKLLYDEPDLFLPHVCGGQCLIEVAPFVNERMIPFLTTFLSAGDEEVFAGLCAIAGKIEHQRIQPVLADLLHRWLSYLLSGASAGHQNLSHHLWRGFNDLVEHSGFSKISGWEEILAQAVRQPLTWWDTQRVTRVLERSPQAYAQIESMHFKSDDWMHFYVCERTRLDVAATRLFQHVSDE